LVHPHLNCPAVQLGTRPMTTGLPKPYYERDGIVIYCADCRDVLPLLPAGSVDLVLTDPPYGVEFRGQDWDRDVPEAALQLPNMYPRVAIIMGTVTAYQFPTPKWVACWERPASNSRSKVGGFSHWSPILLYGDCKMSVDFRSWHAIANAYPPGFGHPSPKPERLMLWLVSELSNPGDLILDPFMGSGTTLVAAKQLGRRAIGIEIEERYCEIAVKRLAQEVMSL
jgi:site-specific DNA-methyltransferase (adenine-specific)